MSTVRMLVVHCGDWPIVAAGVPLEVPAAVVHANRVVATSPAARADDVAVHQRRREAQRRCPQLVIVDHDPARDARAFEPVVAALDAITPRVEIVVPGTVAFPTRGPSRFFGGDEALAARTQAAVEEVLAGVATGDSTPPRCQIGIADGAFAAGLAAGGTPAGATAGSWGAPRAGGLDPVATGGAASGSCRGLRGGSTDPEPAARVIPCGETPAFLAGLPIGTLGRPELVDVLRRLGLRTLGELAALPEAAVLGRFGAEGLLVWRLASGLDERPPALADPPPDLRVVIELDPPAETVAPAAFLARGMAEELHERLWARGSACTQVLIGAETEHGERLERVWRAEGALSPAAIADRLRWQLDGWLQPEARHRPTAGISRLWLVPDEVVPAGGRQLGFWGSDAATADRASRAVARVQGLLGVGSVAVPEWRGSRDPATQIELVAAEAVDLTLERPDAGRARVAGPWPGRLPTPSPAWVHLDPLAVEVVDAAGQSVRVSGRGLLSGAPARLSVAGGPWCEIVEWAGPWPLEERWWDSGRGRRRARVQVVTADGRARLIVLEQGSWQVTATYD